MIEEHKTENGKPVNHGTPILGLTVVLTSTNCIGFSQAPANPIEKCAFVGLLTAALEAMKSQPITAGPEAVQAPPPGWKPPPPILRKG